MPTAYIGEHETALNPVTEYKASVTKQCYKCLILIEREVWKGGRKSSSVQKVSLLRKGRRKRKVIPMFAFKKIVLR